MSPMHQPADDYKETRRGLQGRSGEAVGGMRGDTDQMMTVEALGTRVGFLCETYSTRKRHATINTLRHSYISEMRKNEMRLLDKRQLTADMLHDVYMDERYVRVWDSV